MSKLVKILVGCLVTLALTQVAIAATFTVTKTADTSDGMCNEDCSLREAITAANATSDDDVIEFESPLFNSFQIIVLSLSEIVITNNGSLTINGPGADKLTIDGNNASRIFSINGAVAFIHNLRFTGGNGAGAANTGRAGAIYNNGGTATYTNLVITGNTAANGGGTNHANTATTTYINCVISGNSATGAGGGMQNFGGSTLTMINSTVSLNTSNSTLTGGGAIQANGTLSFTNTTFSGNRAMGGSGGAIFYNGQGLTMNNVTIAANETTSATNAGGLHKSTSTLNANLRNTIIAGNSGSSSPDVSGSISSQGNNLIGTVGSSTGWIGSDLTNQAGLLTPLGYYGGKGMTHALLSGSPAINAGNNCVVDMTCPVGNPPVAVTTDQRGASRPADVTVDIGAFEVSTVYRAVLPNARLNQGYAEIILPNIGLNYFVSSGSLPPGLELAILSPLQSDPKGTPRLFIFGSPTQAGTFDFSLTASDGTNSAVINYRLTVPGSAVNVSVGGRVLNGGLGIVPNALVRITDGASVILTTRSNSFGNYRFSELTPNVPYTITVETKGLSFVPALITPSGNVNNFDLSPTP